MLSGETVGALYFMLLFGIALIIYAVLKLYKLEKHMLRVDENIQRMLKKGKKK